MRFTNKARLTLMEIAADPFHFAGIRTSRGYEPDGGGRLSTQPTRKNLTVLIRKAEIDSDYVLELSRPQ